MACPGGCAYRKKEGESMKKVIVICGLSIVSITVVVLCYFGILWPNNFFANKYSVQGIDVSNYQKDIDWNKVAQNQKIKFVFIKATEGKDYQDKYFKSNWDSATQVGLYKGAYHYFTTKSSGIDQANNFINSVPVEKGCMPPVIDIEESGIDKEKFKKELSDYISIIEETYNQKPILYVVYSLYEEYIKGDFEECPIWIRDIIKPPRLEDERDWIFWQYCNRGRLDGINSYVDINVFYGDEGELKSLLSEE